MGGIETGHPGRLPAPRGEPGASSCDLRLRALPQWHLAQSGYRAVVADLADGRQPELSWRPSGRIASDKRCSTRSKKGEEYVEDSESLNHSRIGFRWRRRHPGRSEDFSGIKRVWDQRNYSADGTEHAGRARRLSAKRGLRRRALMLCWPTLARMR